MGFFLSFFSCKPLRFQSRLPFNPSGGVFGAAFSLVCYSNPGDPQKSVQDQLPLIVGSASAGLVVIVALVVIAVVCLK